MSKIIRIWFFILKMLGLYYHELIRNIEEHRGKKYFMVDDYMLGKVLDKINTKI